MVVILSETSTDDCMDQPSMMLACPAASPMGAFVVLAATTAMVAAKATDDRKFTIIQPHDCRVGNIDRVSLLHCIRDLFISLYMLSV
jgi:hypothetical protein